MQAVIEDLVSVQMIASLVIASLSFFHWSSLRGCKRTHSIVWTEQGKFPWWSGVCFTHYSHHGLDGVVSS